MNNYSTKHTHKHTKKSTQNAGDIQAQIDLRRLFIFFFGQPLFSTAAADTHMNPFDPCGEALHVSNSHYRDPATGDRGGAIKFVQRIRRCSYDQAIAYLEGWNHCQAAINHKAENTQAHRLFVTPGEPHPVQLALPILQTESVCP